MTRTEEEEEQAADDRANDETGELLSHRQALLPFFRIAVEAAQRAALLTGLLGLGD
jgi:hypothetical protein